MLGTQKQAVARPMLQPHQGMKFPGQDFILHRYPRTLPTHYSMSSHRDGLVIGWCFAWHCSLVDKSHHPLPDKLRRGSLL